MIMYTYLNSIHSFYRFLRKITSNNQWKIVFFYKIFKNVLLLLKKLNLTPLTPKLVKYSSQSQSSKFLVSKFSRNFTQGYLQPSDTIWNMYSLTFFKSEEKSTNSGFKSIKRNIMTKNTIFRKRCKIIAFD